MTLHSAVVIGLGRIGLPFALHLASRGALVKGVEHDASRRAAITSRLVVSSEPCLQERLSACGNRLELTELAEAVRASDVSFIAVPTPAQSDGSLSHHLVLSVIRDIAAVVASAGRRHTVVIVSTLMPGTLRGVLAGSVGPAGPFMDLCYSPVLVALGSVFAGLVAPPFILIGADNDSAGATLAGFYEAIGCDPSLFVRTDSTSAEIAKLALNGFLATKIAFANSIADVCDATGVRPEAVLGILGRDPRVGEQYLRPGAPYGGPCLHRDTEAVARFSEACAIPPVLIRAVRRSNDSHYEALLQRALARAPHRRATFGIVGLAYKSNADYLDDGFGLSLAQDLCDRGHRVVVYDTAWQRAGRRPPAGIELVHDLDVLARGCDVCVLTYSDSTERDRLKALIPAGASLLDIWRSDMSA